MRLFICLVIGVMHPVCVPFVVFHHIWVSPIDVVFVVETVVLNVGTCVGMLPHIMEYNYQL